MIAFVEVRGKHALAEIKLPERPDYEAANGFLVKARKEMVNPHP